VILTHPAAGRRRIIGISAKFKIGVGSQTGAVASWQVPIRCRRSAESGPVAMPDHPTTDAQQAQLLRRIAVQDSGALAEFYDQTAASFFSFALRMLNDAHDAEEVIQDVFMQIWHKAPSFDPELGIAFGWSMSIVRNRCIDRLRARQRRARVLVETPEGAELEPRCDWVSVAMPLAADEQEAVRAALGALPEDQKRAIEMAFFAGLSHHEIADALHEPLGTVKARIRRGMLKLRNELEAYA
jgi:RNA polymerase sigma-70 factor (ECF subfamily)